MDTPSKSNQLELSHFKINTNNTNNNNNNNIKGKRIRPSYSCKLCKSRKKKCDKERPSCGNCLKIRKTCEYPPGVVSVKQKLKILQQTLIQENEKEPPEGSEVSLPSKSVLLDQIYRLQKEIESLKTQISNNSDSHQNSPNFQIYGDKFVNLFGEYNILVTGGNRDEDHKPLSHMCFYKRDVYFSFMCFFLLLHLHIAKSMATHQITTDKSLSAKSSKWLNLLDLNKEPAIKQFHDSVILEREKIMNFNGFPLFVLNSPNIEQIINLVKQSLPPKQIMNDYVNFFIENIYPFRPFIDFDDFKSEIERIIQFDHYSSNQPQINPTKPSDIAIIAILMVILRYSSICLRLMNKNSVPQRYICIYNHEISIDIINVCHMCLSFYKVNRKMTLPLFQAFLLLRVYNSISPEQADGRQGTQGQGVMGFLTQAAMSIGLHRDPELYEQINGNIKLTNLRRRLWFGFVELELNRNLANGCMLLIPDGPYTNVKQPEKTEYDTLIQKEMILESERMVPLKEIYSKLIKLFNNMSGPASLLEIVGLVEAAMNYIDENYSLKALVKLDCINYIDEKISVSYRNCHILGKRLIQHTLESHIYHFLRIYFESKTHESEELATHFLQKYISTIRPGLDIALGVLQKSINEYCLDSMLHHLFHSSSALILRCIQLCIPIILQLYHAQNQLKSVDYANKDIVSPSELEEIIDMNIFKVKYLLHVLKQTAAVKSWTYLKVIVGFNYAVEVIESNKFGTITDIVEFINSPISEPAQSDSNDEDRLIKTVMKEKLSEKLSVSALVKEWVKVEVKNHTNGPCYVWENTRSNNLFLEYTKKKLNDLHRSLLNFKNKFSTDIPLLRKDFEAFWKLNSLEYKNGVAVSLATNPRPFFTNINHPTSDKLKTKPSSPQQEQEQPVTQYQKINGTPVYDSNNNNNTNIEFSLSDTLNGTFNSPVWNFNFGNIPDINYVRNENNSQTFVHSLPGFGNLEEILRQFQNEYPS